MQVSCGHHICLYACVKATPVKYSNVVLYNTRQDRCHASLTAQWLQLLQVVDLLINPGAYSVVY